MAQGSKKAVLYAICVNGIITVLKAGAALVTHSAAMMNEAVHSLMDTLNQIFLLIGLKRGEQPADRQYAFGHGQKKYLWNLWSAIGLFSIGCGLGLAHAWHAWHKLEHFERPDAISILGFEIAPVWISAVVLVIAFVLEGYVLMVAGKEFLSRMRAEGKRNPFKYLASADDPTLIAVLLEDSIAVTGVILAATGIGLTQTTGNPIWDIGFSVLIALMLGLTAIFLGKINMRYLTSIRDHDAERIFQDILKQRREIERYHDLRSVIVDDTHTVVVAEVEVREEVLMLYMRERIASHAQELLARVPEHRRTDAVVDYAETRATIQATLEATEQLIDSLEAELKRRCPQVFHLTIEVEGIADPSQLDDPKAIQTGDLPKER
ncbi:cation diffusion facilitator family transporter [Microbulbifer hydrolyticus]|uniref:Cation diffusion facilitator family transporter n=1 Tax=Microbulbifer hydrolyticus TaxID=48074 RepID=A0A6P1T7C1_9GAMM|nr:cation diffusion facilitator family transporter [Microbulbifer hydrolyticus]MBB5210856.1 zinc transporter 9 [Microbulbifer hydrolyticus]QHQ38714.1 cation diffusion facilitator family transporter [Microbulbifer hydrolyticus]